MGGKLQANYLDSTVLDEVALTAMITWEKTYGPFVTVVRIKSEGETIDIGHKSNYGLDSCVFSTSFYRMCKIAKRLQLWEISINGLMQRWLLPNW